MIPSVMPRSFFITKHSTFGDLCGYWRFCLCWPQELEDWLSRRELLLLPCREGPALVCTPEPLVLHWRRMSFLKFLGSLVYLICQVLQLSLSKMGSSAIPSHIVEKYFRFRSERHGGRQART